MDLILEGPEDDSIGVETFCPKNSNIIKFVVFDWYSVSYIGKHLIAHDMSGIALRETQNTHNSKEKEGLYFREKFITL